MHPFEQRSQDLMQSREWQSRFGTHTRCSPNLHPPALGTVGRGCQQLRLADTRLTPEQQGTAAISSISEERVKHVQFTLATDQPRGRSRRGRGFSAKILTDFGARVSWWPMLGTSYGEDGRRHAFPRGHYLGWLNAHSTSAPA